MKTILEAVFVVVLVERCLAITRLSTNRPYITNGWHTTYDSKASSTRHQESFRSSRNTDEYPQPQLPWEEALRHSVYLTLVRDRIDTLLSKNSAQNNGRLLENMDKIKIQEDGDLNLWREIRRAPFKVRHKDRGPIFGDIAILSRGKLIQTQQNGLAFIEDENIKECIECHLYSARTNELEAEKTLRSPCIGPDCDENIMALWTVRRIRHRNYDNEKTPYRYELMFSISSAKTGYENLDYNIPTQTFTIQENVTPVSDFHHTTTQKNPTYYDDNFINKNTYWVRKNVKDTVVFPQSSEVPVLNTGEVYTEKSTFNTRESYYQDDYTLPINVRGNKKFEKNDKVLLEHTKLPTITHLHHHYYLNDEGMPIIRLPHESDRMNVQHISNILDPKNQKVVDTIVREYESSTKPNEPITIPIYVSDINANDSFTTESPQTLQIQLANKIRPNPTKPFKPSPQIIRYSELDPAVTHEVLETTVSESTTQSYVSKSTIRSTRKPFRRLKVQKKFSELINAQLPPPDKNTDTTTPYKVITVTQPSDITIEPNATQPRRKYQRKVNIWTQRYLKSKKKTTLNDNVLESNNNYNTTAEYKQIVVYNTTDGENSTEIMTTPMQEYLNETVLVLDDIAIENDTITTTLANEVSETTVFTTVEPTLVTSTNYANISQSTITEMYTPLTKKSLVTSISLKLGNKTRPYYPRRRQNHTIELKHGRRAKIIEVKRNGSKIKEIISDEDTESGVSGDMGMEVES